MQRGSSGNRCKKAAPQTGRKVMIRLIAVAFALALASSAQAMPPVSVLQPDETVINVREGGGPGRGRVRVRGPGGHWLARPTTRHPRRALRRFRRWEGSACRRYAD